MEAIDHVAEQFKTLEIF